MYFSISGQNNCSGFARRKKGKKKKTLRPVCAADHGRKERRDKTRRGGLSSRVWIPANCLDKETLMSFMSHYLSSFFSSFPVFMVTRLFLSIFIWLSPFLPLCLTRVLPYFSLFYSVTSLYPPFFCAICLPQCLPFSPPGLGSVASNAFPLCLIKSAHVPSLHYLTHTHTHSCVSVPTDLISPSLSSLSLTPLQT